MTAETAVSGLARRYRRPLIVSLAISVLGELSLFLGFGTLLYPDGNLAAKFLWAVILCGIGMGAVIGAAIILTVVDRFEGWRAIAVTSLLVVGLVGVGCNLLCYRLDIDIFGYFGGLESPALFLGSGLVLSLSGGVLLGWLLFSQPGNRTLATLGV